MSGNLAVNASLVVSTFILLYGASFTLIMTCWQAFSTAGWPSVLAGVRALRATSFGNPQPYKTVASGLYAGGLAAITVLRDEGVAAVAIGVDAGVRVAAMLEYFFTGQEEPAFVPTLTDVQTELKALVKSNEVSDDESQANNGSRQERQRQWLSTMRLGLCVATFVALSLLFVKTTRIASLCVLAAQSIVSSAGPLLGARAQAVAVGSREHALLVALVASLGMLVQFMLYIRPPHAWSLPNGSAMPVAFRALTVLPLAVEDTLDGVRKACTCEIWTLRAVASTTLQAYANATGGLK